MDFNNFIVLGEVYTSPIFITNNLIHMEEVEDIVQIEEAPVKQDSEEFSPTMEYVLPKLYDISKKVYGEENVDINLYAQEIIILFPKIEVTNSIGSLHTIKDLYVFIKVGILDKNSDTVYIYLNYNGFRGSLSLKEYLSGYSFSHLSGGVEAWGSFCFGTGEVFLSKHELSEIYINNKEGFDRYLYKFENFLYIFREYLKWESIEGGPYKLISSLGTNRFFTLNNNRVSSTELAIAKNLLVKILENPEDRRILAETCLVNTGDGLKINIYNLTMFLDTYVNTDLFNKIVSESNSEEKNLTIEFDPITYESKGLEGFNIESHVYKEDDEQGLYKKGDFKSGILFSFKGKEMRQKLYEENLDDLLDRVPDRIISPKIVAIVTEYLYNIFVKLKNLV